MRQSPSAGPPGWTFHLRETRIDPKETPPDARFDVARFGLIRWPKAIFTVAWGSTLVFTHKYGVGECFVLHGSRVADSTPMSRFGSGFEQTAWSFVVKEQEPTRR
jgi:hypothetical protein